MLSYRVQAYNAAHDSENKIHDDTVARRFGFSGALVPGVQVYAYMMHLPVQRWGRAFLERGSLECRFARPVYEGEIAEVGGREAGEAMDIEVMSGIRRCATGSARMPAAAPDASTLADFPPASPPAMEDRPDASAATMPVGAMLGTSAVEVSEAFAAAYLRDIRETEALYVREQLVHPGTVLRMANFALMHNVRLGPWIHVGSQVQNFGVAQIGESLAARARVTGNYERKGHLFVELDVLVLAEETRPVARVRHTAIYRPRQMAVEELTK